MKTFTKVFFLLSLFLAVYNGLSQDFNSKIFWTDSQTGKIQSSHLDGTNIQDIVTGVTDPRFITMIAEEAFIFYFTMDEMIMRVNEDGSNLETVLTGLSLPMGIYFFWDEQEDLKMYWTDALDNKIYRANKNGSDVEVVLSGLNQPYAITFDMWSNKMYWTEQNALKRSTADGDSVETVIDWGQPRGLFVTIPADPQNIYWTDSENQNIKRTPVSWVFPEELVSGLNHPADIQYDIYEEKFYWAEYGEGKIMRANIDGTDVQVVVSGLGNPQGLHLLLYVGNGSGIEDEGKKLIKLYVESTTINYTLAERSLVKLLVYNSRGVSIAELVNGYQNPGKHEVKWNADGYTPGIYFYLMQVDDHIVRGKLLTIK